MLTKSHKLVLGAGVNGLVWAAYNPEYLVLGAQPGGGYVNQAAITLLHRDLWTEKLLSDLGVRYTVKTYHVKFVPNDDPDALIRKKTLGRITSASHSRMNEDQHIAVLDHDPQELVDALLRECEGRIIEDTACRIGDCEVVCEKTVYYYDRLVSTLPAPLFWKLRRMSPPGDCLLEAIPTTFVRSDEGTPECKLGDSVYYSHPDVPWVRVSCRQPGEWLYEYPGKVEMPESHWVVPTAVIIANKRNVPPPGTLFLGRMACWDHTQLLGDVVRESCVDADLRFAWERQRWFEAQVFDTNSINVDRVTKDIALALIVEAAEVLNEANFKTHKQSHEVDSAAVRMELVDVFKYCAALAQFHGLDAAAFLSAFDEKSSIVERRFIKDNGL